MSVSVDKLSRRFSARDAPAVHEVSFTAPSGGVTTLLGPSGSGKTTLLRIIAGLEQPDAGAVRFGAEEVTRRPVQKRGVGIVFQGYALFQHLSARDNIAFGLKVQGWRTDAIRQRVDELLELVQLDGLGNRMPGELSGGQRQRVAFARALAPRPQVLLLDEPFGALDTRVRVELRAWLRALHERVAVTTLLVTHDQEEALELSEQVVVLHQGRVEQAGSPAQIYDHPATPFVASFIGNANALQARDADGRQAVAYVRPNEVKLRKGEGEAAGVAAAHVIATTRVGGHVKVEVRLASGEQMTVQLGRGEAETLNLMVGDRVLVDLGDAKLFVEDYSI
jgi:sulfate transport system ATP-binding protein